MVVILSSTPLELQSDTKVLPYKKATLMIGGFLLADSMLKCITDEKIKKRQSFFYINLHNEIYYQP